MPWNKTNITSFWIKFLPGIFSFIFVVSTNSLAQETLLRHSFEVGTEVSSVKYEEPDVMSQTGMMYGLVGSYTYHNKFMLKAEAKGSYGQVDYDGRLSDGTPYTVDDIDDYMGEVRGLVGYDFFVQDSIILTPYIGVGYRYLNDQLNVDVYGYERESNYFYSPIGIEANVFLNDGWSLGGTVEFDCFWFGLQKSHLSDIAAGVSDLENDQEDGYGIRGSIKIQKKGDKLDVLVEPFIKYWSIEESEISAITYNGKYIGYGYEPENNSTEIGARIAVRF